MRTWTNANPCPRCGATHGVMYRCTNCNTVGCDKCLGSGSSGKGYCQVCKKNGVTKV